MIKQSNDKNKEFNEASVLNSLGYGHFMLGDTKTGKRLLLKALRKIEEEERKNFHDIQLLRKKTQILVYLGIVSLSCDEVPKSLEYQKQVLRIRKSLYGKYHLSVATQYNNLGLAYEDSNLWLEAKKNYEKSLYFRLKLFPKGNTYVLIALSNVLHIYVRLREFDKVDKLWKKVQEIMSNVDQKQLENFIAPLYAIYGLYFYEKKDYAKACEIFQKGYEIKDKNFKTIYMFKFVIFYGKSSRLIKKFDESLQILVSAHTIVENIRKKFPEFKYILMLYEELLNIHEQMEDNSECFIYAEKAIKNVDKICHTEEFHDKPINKINEYLDEFITFLQENSRFMNRPLQEFDEFIECEKCPLNLKEFLIKHNFKS